MEEKHQGIVLHSIPYLGKKRILKVFFRDAGLMSLISSRTTLGGVAPFCIAECVYKTKQSDLGSLIDASLIDSLLPLRQSYEILAAAGSIAQELLRSQLPGKHSPGLYDLLCSYFQKLPQFENPEILVASFRLKLLLHEGILSLAEACAECGQPASILAEGESFCPLHAIGPFPKYTKTEWEALFQLTFAKQFSSLKTVQITEALQDKIRLLSS